MNSKKLVLILSIAVLLVAYYWLVTGYIKERGRNSTLETDIENTTLLLADIPVPAADLQERLDTVQARLETAQEILPVTPNTTEIVNTILQLAETAGIRAAPLTAAPWTIEAHDGYNVAVYRLNLTATGTSGQFLDFLDSLENGSFPTLIIENCSVNREAGEKYLEDSFSERSTRIGVEMDIALYARAPAMETADKTLELEVAIFTEEED